jgi:hypothetical protein
VRARGLCGSLLLAGAFVGATWYARGYAPSYAGGFTGAPPAATQTIAWPAGATVNYKHWTGNAAATNVTGGNVTTAVDAAFASINAASGLAFTNNGTQAGTGAAASDSINMVTFANVAANTAAVGGALAITAFYYTIPSYQITEIDMVFNPSFTFTTNATSGQYDLQSVATHEAGHAAGLDHSPLCDATMFPFAYPNQTLLRSLEKDDVAGLRQLYPTAPLVFPLGYGTVTGQINLSTGGGAAGAHVFLTDAVRGTTGPGALTKPSGAFTIAGVPVGIYRLNVEPVNSPMSTSNLGLAGWSGVSFSTNFKTATLGGATPTLLAVKSGVTTTAAALTVTNTAPTLNPTAATTSSPATGAFGFSSGRPAVVAPGYAQFLQLWGAGFNALPDGAFSFDSPYVTITGPSTMNGTLAGSAFKQFPISVAAEAPAGGYAFKVVNAGETAFGAGLLSVSAPTTPVAAVTTYGASCPTTNPIVFATTGGAPSVGNAAFAIRATGTTPGRSVFFLLSIAPDAFVTAGNFSGASSCSILVDLNALVVPFPGFALTASTTTTTQPLAIPPVPGFSGLDVYAQAAEVDGGTGAIKLSQGALIAVR